MCYYKIRNIIIEIFLAFPGRYPEASLLDEAAVGMS